MVKISTSPRYMIDITGTDLLSWGRLSPVHGIDIIGADQLNVGELGGGVNSKKNRKNEVFLTYERVIVS